MSPRAIITSLPLLRRAWRWLPGPLRIPVLIVGAVVGLWYLVTGRRDQAQPDGETSG